MTDKLTPATARALDSGKVLRDEHVTGLELHAGTLSKSWKLYYRFEGREHRPTLGHFPEMPLSSAREVAKAWKLRIAKGENPSAARQASREAPTVNDLCDRYLDEWAPRHKSPRSIADDTLRINRYVRPALGRKRVAEVSRADIDGLLEAVLKRKLVKARERWKEQKTSPGQALQVRRLVSKLWNLAQKDFGLDPRDKNPVSGAMSFRTDGRERFATREETARLSAALSALETERPLHAACLWTIFLTGARVAEIRDARTDELQGNRLVKIKHKTARRTGKKEIALPRAAMRLLEQLPRDGERLFGDIDLRRVWRRLRREAGFPDLQLLDARRTFLSYGLSLGETMDTLAKQAGHTQPTTTAKHYAHLLEDTKDRVANRIADDMLLSGSLREGD